ncbi:MAG: FGGY-family carbohydrate kinase [Theionarchaea archaeon]|nr:FGGY-family carbohydrate kinase [Theionarchaea archaeon]MBU7021719.1 FGGY-family carbohydrate kinase [Theionarchaea archaeon]
MKYILAHDVGTSGSKGTLIDYDLNIRAACSSEYEVLFPREGYAEQDPEDWWKVIVSTTRALLEENQVSPEDVAAVVFSAQMAGVLPVDAQGTPLMNCMTWLDSRAEEQAQRIIARGIVKVSGYSLIPLLQFLRITGGSPGKAGKDAISKIVWLKEEAPEIYQGSHRLLDVKDFLIYRCTGEFITSRDCANVSWMMDTRPGKLCWSPTILNKYGIDVGKLPEIRKSTDIAGTITKSASRELAIPEGTPVITGAGDMASAALGSGAVLPGEPHVYVGTSSWIAAHVPTRKKDLSHYMGSICSGNPDLYMLVAEQETASGCLEWIKRNIVSEWDYQQLNQYVSEVEPGAGGVIFTPWLFGERSPLDDSEVRAGFYNLSLEHTRGHMARAVYEGVAVNISWAFQHFARLISPFRTDNVVNLIGGGAQSDVWCQIFADAFGRPVARMENPVDAGARGAAALALLALGHLERVTDIKKLVAVERRFEPREQNIRLYSALREEFKRIYKKRVSTKKGEKEERMVLA